VITRGGSSESSRAKLAHNMLQSLILADKVLFRNCLVAMRPNAIKADLPSMHDVTTLMQNSFIDFMEALKARINVSETQLIDQIR
jgi:hypothetical protein